MNKALLIIDIQNDYFEKGKNPLVYSNEASLKAKEVLTYFRKNKLPVFHIQHINTKKDATFFVCDTKGVNIHENVAPLSSEIVIKKNFPNSFLKTKLKEELEKKDIKELVICGMMSHMCIDSTTRAAFDLAYKCTVLSDACATKDLEFLGEKIPAKTVHNSYMAALKTVFSQVISVKEYIKEE